MDRTLHLQNEQVFGPVRSAGPLHGLTACLSFHGRPSPCCRCLVDATTSSTLWQGTAFGTVEKEPVVLKPFTRAASLGALAVTAVSLSGLTLPAAAADPVTTEASFPRGSLSATVSDTTLMPGDTFTVEVDYTNTFHQLNISTFVIKTPVVPDHHLFVLDDCTTATGQDPYCSTPWDEVRSQVLVPAAGTETVTFELHVSDDAEPGAYPLAFYTNVAGTEATPSPPVTFTVVEPAADLGV
uniref:hypothetical protein n=1 Tax=Isoptericola aurantiacus TaxID=3377839 RepID=UPI00383BBDA0